MDSLRNWAGRLCNSVISRFHTHAAIASLAKQQRFGHPWFIILVVLVLVANPRIKLTAFADLIDFEHIAADPNEEPADDGEQQVPYNITQGVPEHGTIRFFFDVDEDWIYDAGNEIPLFERRGRDGDDAFISHWQNPDGRDNPRAGYAERMGDFFLR